MGHRESVHAWVGDDFARLTHDERVTALERSFTALWRRAAHTLGEVTLGVICDRVMTQARQKFPFLGSAVLDHDGLKCDALRAAPRAPAANEMEAAMSLVLVELLTVLGNLTAEIMTPALHETLAGTPPPGAKAKKSRQSLPATSTKRQALSPKTGVARESSCPSRLATISS